MTTLSAYPLVQDMSIAEEPARWPWLTTLLILVAFLLAIHDPMAGREWQRTTATDLVVMGQLQANGSLSRQAGFILLGAVGLVLTLRPRRQEFAPHLTLIYPFAMLLIWAMASVAWSADVGVTIRRQVVLVSMLLTVFGLLRQYPLHTIVEMAFVHTFIVVILGIIAECLYAPPVDPVEGYRFAGTLHPNHAGLNAAFLLMSCLYLAQRRGNWKFLIVAAAAMFIVVLTKSRTSLAGAIAGVTAFVLATRPPRHRIALYLSILFAIGVSLAAVASDALPNVENAVLLDRHDSDPTTLTGRTMIWQFVIDHLSADAARMMSGFGYGGFWTKETSEALSRHAQFKLSEAHNDYLEMMSQLGIVGLVLYLWGLLGVLFSSIGRVKRYGSVDAALAVGLIVLTFVHSISESAMTLPVFTSLVLWVVLGASVLARPEEAVVGGAS